MTGLLRSVRAGLERRLDAAIGGRHDGWTGTPVSWAAEARTRALVVRHVLRGSAVLYRATLPAADIVTRADRQTIAVECEFSSGVRVHTQGAVMPAGEFEGVTWDRDDQQGQQWGRAW